MRYLIPLLIAGIPLGLSLSLWIVDPMGYFKAKVDPTIPRIDASQSAEYRAITFPAVTDTPETTFVVGPDVTHDETWTINTALGSRSVMSLKGPNTLTFYFGNEHCGQLKCNGQTISFTGDIDKSAQEFVDMVNKIFEWQQEKENL